MPLDRRSSSEAAAIELLTRLAGPTAKNEVWIGDDAAVLELPAKRCLFATDVCVEGVHFDRGIGTLADAGWRALVQNLSDIAAMAGAPHAAVVTVAGATISELSEIYEGLIDASVRFACPVVGGDISDGSSLDISVAIVGIPGPNGPVLRSGSRAGDAIFVTGALGSAAAGLRLIRQNVNATGALVEASLRPAPRLKEGAAAGRAGATAMIDISDGLGIDLHRLADASGVGVSLDGVPIYPGAELEDALGGGEEYELVFSAPDPGRVVTVFNDAGLRTPIAIGRVLEDREIRELEGKPLPRSGFEHRLEHS